MGMMSDGGENGSGNGTAKNTLCFRETMCEGWTLSERQEKQGTMLISNKWDDDYSSSMIDGDRCFVCLDGLRGKLWGLSISSVLGTSEFRIATTSVSRTRIELTIHNWPSKAQCDQTPKHASTRG